MKLDPAKYAEMKLKILKNCNLLNLKLGTANISYSPVKARVKN